MPEGRDRLYLDEDVLGLKNGLLALSYDVRTAIEEGMKGDKDYRHLHRAVTTDRILISFNVKDYKFLHKIWLLAGGHHPGIIMGSRQPSRVPFIQAIDTLLQNEATDVRDRLLIWLEDKNRWRSIPPFGSATAADVPPTTRG